ncbi:MAG: helix-turn-helix transcriptional regulator [Verrucomicrobiia bacterium]
MKVWTPNKIRQLRAAAGLNQAQLAEWLGVDQKHVSHLETGFRPAGPQTVRLLTMLEKMHKGELKAVQSQGRKGRHERSSRRSSASTKAGKA